jgi:hypothetical protein
MTASSTIGFALISRLMTTGESASSGSLFLMASTFLVASMAAVSAFASKFSSSMIRARS